MEERKINKSIILDKFIVLLKTFSFFLRLIIRNQWIKYIRKYKVDVSQINIMVDFTSQSLDPKQITLKWWGKTNDYENNNNRTKDLENNLKEKNSEWELWKQIQ